MFDIRFSFQGITLTVARGLTINYAHSYYTANMQF
jgi:hypothetical protein